MTRLTKDLREAILTKIMHRGFYDRLIAQIEREKEWAEEVYQYLYGADLPLLAKVPERWLDRGGMISLKIGNEHTQISWTWGISSSTFRRILSPYEAHKTRILPCNVTGLITAHYFGYGEPLAMKFEQIHDARNDLETAYKKAMAQANALLESVSTVSKLIKTWPEIESIVRDVLGQEPAPVPSLPTEDLNKIFDLPPETKAA